MTITEAECRKLLQEYSAMVKQHVQERIGQAECAVGRALQSVEEMRREQIEVTAAVHFLKGIVPPSVREILIAAGWTAPVEGCLIKLTKKQAKKLADVLGDAHDKGPLDEGWASDELIELRCIADRAVGLLPPKEEGENA